MQNSHAVVNTGFGLRAKPYIFLKSQHLQLNFRKLFAAFLVCIAEIYFGPYITFLSHQ